MQSEANVFEQKLPN